MKRKLLSFGLLAAGLLTAGNAMAEDAYDVTWNFADSTVWQDGAGNAKIDVSDASKQYDNTAAEVTSGGVTFNFTSTSSAYFKVSRTTCLWWYAAGSHLGNNISIDVPAGYRATFTFGAVSKSRPFYFTTTGGTDSTMISSTEYSYNNEGTSTVTLTIWASNPMKDGSSNNRLNSLRLRDVSNLPTHSYTATAKCGDTVLDTWTVSEIEEESKYNVYAKYIIEKDSKYYVLNDDNFTSTSTGSFGYAQTMGTEDASFEISYEEYNGENEIVYFIEAEDLNSNTNPTENTDRSGGKNAYITGSKKASIGNFGIGTYSIEVGYVNDRNVLLRNSGSDNTTNTILTFTGGSMGSSQEFTLKAATDLYLTGYTTTQGKLNQSGSFDYVLIKKISDDVTESISTAKEYVTYCNADGALDFSSTSSIKAYTASVNDNGDAITLTLCDVVPANTGVVLYTESGNATESVPYTSTEASVSNNELIGVTEATTVYQDKIVVGETETSNTSGTNYVLQDGTFYLANSNGNTLKAGKAYLQSSKASTSSAKGLPFVFEGATGINEVSSAAKNGKMYNLQGVEVNAPAQGLYIMNGKKVIVK